jgi:predicted DNA-binding transcriptional regulator AlpA
MPLLIDGIEYYSMAEVVAAARVSRATFWRWRTAGQVPSGNLLRGKRVVFTSAELAAIRSFALRVEPISSEPKEQLPLFGRDSKR